MIGDIKVIDGRQYFQANRNGTLVKLEKVNFWAKFWLELRDCFKKWDMVEAVEFAKRHQKNSI